jgi:hypothetical protein
MKILTLTLRMVAVLGAVTASMAACGAETDKSKASGNASGNAGMSSSGGGSGAAGSANNGGTASAPTCSDGDCGPALGLPNTICADGSMGGPTGRCLRLEMGGCGWEVRDCPPAGDGGAASSGGGPPMHGGAGVDDGGADGAGGAPQTDRCGGCNDAGPAPEICIYQVGGPGPGGFACAEQNPCGAAGACACIVDQGPCNFMSEAGGPGYCLCDNGLD